MLAAEGPQRVFQSGFLSETHHGHEADATEADKTCRTDPSDGLKRSSPYVQLRVDTARSTHEQQAAGMKEGHTQPVSPARYAVTITYSAAEDRLFLYCRNNSNDMGLLYLTRRITRNIIQGVVRILGNATPNTLRVPHELQKHFLHFEHQSALSRSIFENHSELPKWAELPKLVFLVEEVNVGHTPDSNYTIVWRASQKHFITMTMSRMDLHCLIHIMQQHAQNCGWDLPPLPYWMQPGDGQPEHTALLS